MHRQFRPRSLLSVIVALVVVLAFGALTAGAQDPGPPLYPDIQEQLPNHFQVQNEHQREMLRFTTSHINLGAGTLRVRGGGQIAPCDIDGVHYEQCTIATQEILDASGNIVLTHPAGVAVFHPEHNHWHQSAVAAFEIRQGSLGGPLVGTGVKVTFCLVDVELVYPDRQQNPRNYWDCNGDVQGITPGWLDSYHQSTPGQELDITGMPAGVYFLTHLVDPENHWLESDESNNFAWVKFELVRQGANAKVKLLDHSDCSGVTCGSGGNP